MIKKRNKEKNCRTFFITSRNEYILISDIKCIDLWCNEPKIYRAWITDNLRIDLTENDLNNLKKYLTTIQND